MNAAKNFARKIIKHKSFSTLIVALLLLGVLDQAARKYGLFFLLSGYDKILHTIGGFISALFAYIVISVWQPHWSRKKKFFVIVGFALFIGLWVEIGEFFMNAIATHPLPFDPIDTAGDLLFDVMGGLLAWAYYLG